MANLSRRERERRERRERERREGAEVNSYLAQCRAVRCGKGSAIYFWDIYKTITRILCISEAVNFGYNDKHINIIIF